MYNETFKKFVEKCYENSVYVGGGNPFAQILFVGKEGSNELNDENVSNSEKWFSEITTPQNPAYTYIDVETTKKEGHTWTKYQKLHNTIFPDNLPKGMGEINFLERIFTTEMNIKPSKTTSEARTKEGFRDRVKDRQKLFRESDFIQSFPIVLLACWDYYQNTSENEDLREIDTTFDVRFKTDKKVISSSGKEYPYYLHYDEKEEKLVIHSYQLSGAIPDDYLMQIAVDIREHLQKINKKA